MSHTLPADAISTPNFQLIFNNALKAYEKRTKSDLLAHPLAAQLQPCDSPNAILLLLNQQVQELNQSRASDERLTKWLDPTVNVLYAFSGALGEGVGLVFSPAKVIFAGVGVLLLAARDVRASQESLIDIFERMGNFFQRLEVYTEVPPTPQIMDIIMKIMVEVLTILAIATKEINQGRTKRFLKKLAGKTDIEDALKRLDTLTNEEARMATAQVLKVAHNIDNRVRGVDDRVAAVDDQVAGVGNRVFSAEERVKAVDDKVAEVIDATDGKEAKTVLDQIKWNQVRENLRKWLSPPDPSTNHNIACAAHHEGSATWFSQGSMFKDWKLTGSLLWIHGKPGSGKSVLCSTIIQEIKAICKTGQATIAYFYFDFRDADKQRWHDLVHSLLTQLSARSGPRSDILSRLYDDHDNGAQQPSDGDLIKCLKEMLMLSDELPVYLILDALDECTTSSGIPSPRERVLQLVKDLVNLRLPNLHVCVTSRPEIDIRSVLEPLTSCRVSLHDQTGQRKDIEDYVRSVVYSNSEPIMRRWRKEDKDLVVKTLSERADGMFRWTFCQLEVLRHCLPPSLRRTLDELPESLDETYERMLKEIKKPNRDHARRLLQCLVVAVRPLQVEELAEVLAVDFDDAGGIPKLNASWRWEDQEQALLSSCSSLITIVNDSHPRVVQFSHFSVKEFLTSPRLLSSSADVLRYHVDLESAHTIFAQACLSVLLQSDDRDEKHRVQRSLPLVRYAARHWVSHAQFRDVSTHLRKGMEDLFDIDKPYFSAWLRLHDIDTDARPKSGMTFFLFSSTTDSRLEASPLYYASLCGFHDLARYLIVKGPEQVNARGGYYVTPLVAALSREDFQMAELLRHHGADPNIRGYEGKTPLHSSAFYGDLQMVQELLKYNADISTEDVDDRTPLSDALERSTSNGASIVRLLLERGVDVNGQLRWGSTPLHHAVDFGNLEVARVLLEYGANVQAENEEGKTPLEIVPWDCFELMELLLEHGAK